MDFLQTVCRFCQCQENLSDLTSQEYEDAARKLADVTTIRIQVNDSLPRYACNVCIGTLYLVHAFLQRCRATEQRLQKVLRQEVVKYRKEMEMTIKEEPLDTMEDAQQLYETVSSMYTAGEDLTEGEMNQDEHREDIVSEEAKLTKLLPTDKDRDTEELFCETGGKVFTESSEIHQHAKTRDEARLQRREESFRCHSCPKSFKSSIGLQRHVQRAHLGILPNVCGLCGSSFSGKANLTKHLYYCKNKQSPMENTRKHSDTNRKCTFCGKNFNFRSHLIAHLPKHTKEQPFECKVCHKNFSYERTLKKHQRIHSDERPYKCDLCNWAFRRSGHLTEHKLVHSGEKPFECTVCKSAFRRRRLMIMHMRIHDEPMAPQQSVKKLLKEETLTAIAEEDTPVEKEFSEAIHHEKEERKRS